MYNIEDNYFDSHLILKENYKMFSLLLCLFIVWLLLKLGVGIAKALIILIAIGIVAIFVSYILLPLLAILALVGLGALLAKSYH